MTGPHPLPPEDRPPEALPPERLAPDANAITPRSDEIRDNAVGATFQAMAEALRANAEALHKIDSSQRQMAETLRKGDKVTQVVTSTKALNETFRGLSEIQRGLLETLVRERGNRGGSASPWGYIVMAILAGLLSILVWERMTDDGRLPRELYDQARRRSSELSAQLAGADAREHEFEERVRTAESERNDLRLESTKDSAELTRLQGELERNKAQMGNYLEAKEQAEMTGATLLQNDQLRRQNADLRSQIDRLRIENERFWKSMADGVVEGRMGDPEAIIKRARDKGVIPQAAKKKPDGSRSARELTLIRRKLKRLLEGAPGEAGYELLMLKSVKGSSSLQEIEVGRYEKHLSVGSIVCKELEVRVDVEKDAVELRFKDGHISNLNKPGEKIPLDPEGHSVFIQGVGVKNWLSWAGSSVTVEPGGLLSWN